MGVSEIREALRKQPFSPFVLHVADGREFPIEHVDLLLISHNDRSIIAAGLKGGYEVIDSVMVTSLSVSETATESG